MSITDRMGLTGKGLTEKTLDVLWKRNEVISQNIANVDTPGYKKKSVAFEEYLDQAMDDSSFRGYRTNPKHIPIGEGTDSIENVQMKVIEDQKDQTMRLDGNSVDIDNEMALMAKNTIQYNTLIQRISGEFKKLKSVISEGRR